MRILEASQPAKWVDLDSLCRTYHAQDAAIMNDFVRKMRRVTPRRSSYGRAIAMQSASGILCIGFQKMTLSNYRRMAKFAKRNVSNWLALVRSGNA